MSQFRLANEADAEQLLHLTRRAYQPIRELGIHFSTAHADLDYVKKNINENLCYVFVGGEGVIQASVSVRLPWSSNPGPLGLPHIWWFAVDPINGRNGIGSSLLSWCEREVVHTQLKSPAVSLGTSNAHPWLVDYYKQRGYHVVEGLQNGKRPDAVFMKKKFSYKEEALEIKVRRPIQEWKIIDGHSLVE